MLDFDDVVLHLLNPSACQRMVLTFRHISQEMRSHNASNSEKTQLLHTAKRLAKSNSAYDSWCGINVLIALLMDQTFSLQYSADILDLLIHLMGASSLIDRRLLRSCLRCSKKILEAFWAAPTHTREDLTHRLPQLISVCLKQIQQDPYMTSCIIQSIIRNHPTTSRPFINKICKEAFGVITSETFSHSFSGPVLCLPPTVYMAEKLDPQNHWLEYIKSLLNEINLTFSVFENFIIFDQLESLKPFAGNITESYNSISFPHLEIEANSLESLMQISERLEHLFSLLEMTFRTSTGDSVHIPIGNIVSFSEIISSLCLTLADFQPHLRSSLVKKSVCIVLLQAQESVFKFLGMLECRLKGSILPYSSRLLEIFDHQARSLKRIANSMDIGRRDPSKLLQAAGHLLCLIGYSANVDGISSLLTLAVEEMRVGMSGGADLGNVRSFELTSQVDNLRMLAYLNMFTLHSAIPQSFAGTTMKKFLTSRVLTKESTTGQDSSASRGWVKVLSNLAKSASSPIPMMRELLDDDQIPTLLTNSRLPLSVFRGVSQEDTEIVTTVGGNDRKRISPFYPTEHKKSKLNTVDLDRRETFEAASLVLREGLNTFGGDSQDLRVPDNRRESRLSEEAEPDSPDSTHEEEIEIPILQMETDSESESVADNA